MTADHHDLVPQLERIAAELEGDLDDVVDAMDAAAVALVPVLGRDPAIAADVHAGHRGNLVRRLALIRRGEQPGRAQVPPEALDVARTIVRRGLEVDAILHAYRSGQRVAWGAWMERASQVVPPGPDLVREASHDLLFGSSTSCSTGSSRRSGRSRRRWPAARCAAARRPSA